MAKLKFLGGADTGSKQEPLRLHVALLNSLRTLYEAGAKDELITYLHGSFSRTAYKRNIKFKSKFIDSYTSNVSEFIIVHYDGEAVKLGEVVESIGDDGVPEIAITAIRIIIPWTSWSRYKLENIQTSENWRFRTYTFRKGIWDRLKAETFPAQKLYQRYKEIRGKFLADVDEGTKKRWRDAMLLNRPKKNLDNQEIRQMWINKPYALLLKETRGQFELMDLGEWRV